MLEGNELAFYRIHVIADHNENMHVYYLRYERSSHHLKVDNHNKSQFEDYKSEDVIDKFSSKDVYSIIKFLTPIVSQFRHLYISEKNLAQFSEAVIERSNKVLKKYFIKLQEQMYIKIECNLQLAASKVLQNLGITETHNHFVTFVDTIMPDIFSGESAQSYNRSSSSSLIGCFKRIIGYLFIKEIRKKSFPTNEDLESLLNYQIWDWASPKKPSVAFDLFSCYILKFLFCNQNTDPFDRLHEVTKKWRVIISTANYINYYPEIHHPWIQLSILTAIPNIAELVETAYSSLVKLKLEEILSISCVKNLLRLGVSLGDVTELISYLPFYINYSPRKPSSSKLKSPPPKNKTKGNYYKSPHSSFSSKLEESEETIDLSLVESTEEIIVNEEISCKDSSDKTTSWGSSFSSFLGIKKTRANDNLSNFSASEEDLKYKELELNLREKELRDKENLLEKRMKELQLLESGISANQNGD